MPVVSGSSPPSVPLGCAVSLCCASGRPRSHGGFGALGASCRIRGRLAFPPHSRPCLLECVSETLFTWMRFQVLVRCCLGLRLRCPGPTPLPCPDPRRPGPRFRASRSTSPAVVCPELPWGLGGGSRFLPRCWGSVWGGITHGAGTRVYGEACVCRVSRTYQVCWRFRRSPGIRLRLSGRGPRARGGSRVGAGEWTPRPCWRAGWGVFGPVCALH